MDSPLANRALRHGKEWSRKPGRTEGVTGPVATLRVAVDQPRDPPGQDSCRVLRRVATIEQTGSDGLGHQRPGLITGARQQELAPGGRGTDPVLQIPASGVAQARPHRPPPARR
jgi:hypothetical protein